LRRRAMELQKINVKFFIADPEGVRLEEFINVFNTWIQSSNGEFYDVTDYSHVHDGPGIVLVAHEANIGIDGTGGRLGLLYNRKQPLSGTNQERLRFVFRSALENCRKLEQDSALRGRLSFLGNEATLLINDRLIAPNTEEVFEEVRPDIQALAQSLYQGTDVTLERGQDPRERFNVAIKSARPFDLLTVLRNLDTQ
jgi:hypothetical protein